MVVHEPAESSSGERGSYIGPAIDDADAGSSKIRAQQITGQIEDGCLHSLDTASGKKKQQSKQGKPIGSG